MFDTQDTVIVGSGAINMATETLNLTVTPYSKDFSPLTLRAPISVGGTFKSPEFFPDPSHSGNKTIGERIINAILTPILGLLPPFDTELGKNADCQNLIERAKRYEFEKGAAIASAGAASLRPRPCFVAPAEAMPTGLG